jgi:hypothetical protein
LSIFLTDFHEDKMVGFGNGGQELVYNSSRECSILALTAFSSSLVRALLF